MNYKVFRPFQAVYVHQSINTVGLIKPLIESGRFSRVRYLMNI